MAIRRNVDLGPIYLPVGEEVVRDSRPTPGTRPDAAAVQRFNEILQRDRRRRQGGHQRGDEDLAPEDLLGSVAGAETDSLPDPVDVGAEIAHLWVGTGLRSAREVRVGLRESLLPGTSVRMHEVEGRLCVDFTCSDHRIALWLDGKLPLLGQELGERLDRDMVLAITMDDGHAVSTFSWAGSES